MMLHARLPFSLDPLIAEAKQRARRRRWLILFVLVVAIAAADAALELRSAFGSGPPAASERPVVHVVMVWPPSTVDVDLRTGRQTVQTDGEQMWFQPGRNGWHHIISTAGGRPVAEELLKGRYGPTTQAAAVDRFYASLGTGYRAALKNGAATVVGRGTAFGHSVDWLSLDLRYRLSENDIGVDAHTLKPIALRFPSGKRYFYARVLLARTIAYNPHDFKRRGAPRQRAAAPGRLAPGYAFGSVDSAAQRSTVVRAPWLTAGATVAGLRLRAVTPFTIRKTKHRFYYGAPKPKAIHGLALVYGPASSGIAAKVPTPVNVYGGPKTARAATPFTIVYEVPQSPRVPPWSLVSPGLIEIQTGYTNVGNRVVPTPWIGYLQKPGFYITISSPEGQRVLLQVAHSLHGGSR